jgi:hypothetical protein
MPNFNSSPYLSTSLVDVRENPRHYSKSFLEFGIIANLGRGGFCNQIIQIVHAESISQILKEEFSRNVNYYIGKFPKLKNKNFNNVFSYIDSDKRIDSGGSCNFFLQRGWGLLDEKAASRAHRVLQIMGVKINKKEYMNRYSANFKKIKFKKNILKEAGDFSSINDIDFKLTLGVHLRTNDHDPKKGKFFKSNDFDKCISSINETLKLKNLNCVYISGTDRTNRRFDNKVGLHSEVVKYYKEKNIKIISDNESSYIRDSPEWIRDLIILSKCRFSTGHEASTFSFLPSFLGDSEFIPIK